MVGQLKLERDSVISWIQGPLEGEADALEVHDHSLKSLFHSAVLDSDLISVPVFDPLFSVVASLFLTLDLDFDVLGLHGHHGSDIDLAIDHVARVVVGSIGLDVEVAALELGSAI